MTARRGYSLIELLIVIAILALIATIAAPALSGNSDASLQRAATEVVRALRFAQGEAIRSGRPYGVIADTGDQSIKVYRLDDSVNPPVIYYDVRDPVTKQLYDLRFDGSDVKVTDSIFRYVDVVPSLNLVGFAGYTGVPKYNALGTIHMLEDGRIDITHGSESIGIRVAPVTGRVTVE